MKKFVVDKKVFERLPGYCLGVVIARGIDNSVLDERITEMLNKEIIKFLEVNKDRNIKELSGIMIYRDAFKELGINPNKFMCSIEALAKRVQKSGKLPNINSIVDLVNAFSVKYSLPMGAHDIDKMEENLEIRFSTLNDHFLGMGECEAETMPEGELVYISGNTVKTRRWIWRQSDEGKITNKTKNVFFPIDGFENSNFEDVLNARDELADFLKEKLNCDVKVGYVNEKENEIIIEL